MDSGETLLALMPWNQSVLDGPVLTEVVSLIRTEVWRTAFDMDTYNSILKDGEFKDLFSVKHKKYPCDWKETEKNSLASY